MSNHEAAQAAMMFIRAYTEGGPISKRGAVQSAAWARLRASVGVPDTKAEARRAKRRVKRARLRRKERPYSKDRIESLFEQYMREGFEAGLGITEELVPSKR